MCHYQKMPNFQTRNFSEKNAEILIFLGSTVMTVAIEHHAETDKQHESTKFTKRITIFTGVQFPMSLGLLSFMSIAKNHY